MELKKFIVDNIVDIILSDGVDNRKLENRGYWKGFYLQKSYIQSSTVLKNSSPLITEEYLIGLLNQGKRKFELAEDSIVTPLARMLIEEGKILVNE